jgi:predicted nuclease of predicted toxin-antitoxin system
MRDLGMRGAPDHIVWRRAVAESRVLVTINARDFVKLAGREEIHGGLIPLLSGSPPETQLALILAAIARLEAEGEINQWAKVGEDGAIECTALPPLPL